MLVVSILRTINPLSMLRNRDSQRTLLNIVNLQA
jgi:hypothetical protein